MSKITIDRALLEHALNAILNAAPQTASQAKEQLESLLALQEALAQPQQEPVAVVVAREYDDGSFAGHQLEWRGNNEEDDLPVGAKLYTSPPARKPSNQPDSVAGYVSKIESLIKERDGLKERLSNSLESGGIKTVEIDRIKHDHHPAFAFRECEDSHAGEPVQPTIAGVPPELFAQQIAAAMRFADAPLTHDQFVTLVLYLKARGDGGADNPTAKRRSASA